MAKTIPQIKETLDTEVLGWFFLEREGTKEREVFVAVPGLDGIGRLMLHSIDVNGGVSPSVKITGSGKDGKPFEFHDYLILENWPKGIAKEAGAQFIPAAV